MIVSAPLCARSRGRFGGRRDVLAVHVQRAGPSPHRRVDVARPHGQRRRTVPEHRAIAGARVDQHDRELRRDGAWPHRADIHALAFQTLARELAELVVAEPADVPARQPSRAQHAMAVAI